jgi:regulator of protease activity HflC (stomatin/prohibitin superfamily)
MNTKVTETTNETPKFNQMQFGRALYIWTLRNLNNTLVNLGIKSENVGNVLSPRQCFIKTLLSMDEVKMEQQGVETYYRNIHLEYVKDDGVKAKLVTQEEIDSVTEYATPIIESAVSEYLTSLSDKEAKVAEKAAKKAERDAAAIIRAEQKAIKDQEKGSKKAEREAARQAKIAAKEAEKARKVAEKAEAQRQAKALRDEALGLSNVSEG